MNLRTLILIAALAATRGMATPSLTWFEATGDSNRFEARTAAYRIQVTSQGWTMPGGLSIRFSGAAIQPGQLEKDAPVSLAYLPVERSLRRRITGSARTLFTGIYKGVDLRYHFADGLLEYDLLLAPGAELDMVRIASNGSVSLLSDGTLEIRRGTETLRKRAPVAWQDFNGLRRSVAARYRRCGSEICLALGSHDPHRALVLDPVISYATYFGTANSDYVDASATDGAGNLYIAGRTDPTTFPFTSPAPPELTPNGYFSGLYLAKFALSGQLIYADLLPYSSLQKLAVDAVGSAYLLVGYPGPQFRLPETPAWIPTPPQLNIGTSILLKLNAPGNDLTYSTYTAGTVGALLPAPTGEVYLAGYLTGSPDILPVYSIYKVSTGGTEAVASAKLEYPTDVPSAMGFDASGNVIVAGTSSSLSPRAGNAFQPLLASRVQFASTDSGQTWAPAANELRTLAVWQDRAVSGRLWAVSGGSLLASTDFGGSWQIQSALDPTLPVIDLVTVPGQPGLIYILTPGVLLRSGDAGVTWTRLTPGYLSRLAVDPSNPNNLFAQSFTQPLVSRDGGQTWTYIFVNGVRLSNSPLFATVGGGASRVIAGEGSAGLFAFDFAAGTFAQVNTINALSVVPDPVRPGNAYVVVVSNGIKIYSTSDAGRTLQPLGAPGGAQTIASVLVPDPADGNVLYLNTRPTLLRSADAGQTWQPRGATPAPSGFGNSALFVNPLNTSQLLLFRAGTGNAFFTSFSPDLSTINGSTYLGGNGDETVSSVTSGPDGLITVSGTTTSLDVAQLFGGSHTDGFTDRLQGGSDTYVARFSPDFSLKAAFRLLGGAGYESGSVAHDPLGNILAGGYSTSPDFPVVGQALGQPPKNTATFGWYFTAMDLNLNILYSSFLNQGNGGSSFTAPLATPDGRAWVAGDTQSTDLPTTAGAPFRKPLGYQDIYLMLLDWQH